MTKTDSKMKEPQKKRRKKWIRWVILGSILSFLLWIGMVIGLAYLLLWIVIDDGFQEKPHIVHHPALYSVQYNFFTLDDKVCYFGNEYCLIFENPEESKRIELDHHYDKYYVANNKLYMSVEHNVYVYDSNFNAIDSYDMGDEFYSNNFFVKSDYIYYGHYNFKENLREFYKYSMTTRTKIVLNSNKEEIIQTFPKEGIYYNGSFHDFEENVYLGIQSGDVYYNEKSRDNFEITSVFYNKNQDRIEIIREKNNITINNNPINFNYDFNYDFTLYNKQFYLNTEYLVFLTYNYDNENCSEYCSCISHLKDLKLWKYNYKTNELFLIKVFNDYTILISFDENNYHYYYDGKLYSNDMEVKVAPKIEVGSLFTYYSDEKPYFLSSYNLLKSITKLAFISGDFYVIHDEINSDIEEYHEH